MSFQLPKMSAEDADSFEYLASVVYPGSSIEAVYSVLMSFKQLDMKPRPGVFHIVPMYDRASRSMVDRVMPGINFQRIQASRSGCCGISEPEYGPPITESYGGVKMTHPEWCRVVVKKLMPNGTEAEFSNLEYWTECFSSNKEGKPTDIWKKRPYAMLAKTTEAGALRKGFPEVASEYTAEEMMGHDLFGPEDAPARQADPNADLAAIMPKSTKEKAKKAEKAEPKASEPAPEETAPAAPVAAPVAAPEASGEVVDVNHPELPDDAPLTKDQLQYAKKNFVPHWPNPSLVDETFPARYVDCKQVHFRVMFSLVELGEVPPAEV